MATEKEALAVVQRHASRLRKLGVHAIGTEEVPGENTRGYVVVARVTPDFKGSLPETLGCTINGTKVKVPLRAVRTPKFRAE